jgi:hypothetical protein
VRVRTYCFPGCFTRPPRTSTRNHPHESDHVEACRPRGYVPFSIPRPGLVAPSSEGPDSDDGKPGSNDDGRQRRRPSRAQDADGDADTEDDPQCPTETLTASPQARHSVTLRFSLPCGYTSQQESLRGTPDMYRGCDLE